MAIAEEGRSGEGRLFGEIDNTAEATAKLVKKLAAKYERLAFCYEAGQPGMAMARELAAFIRAASREITNAGGAAVQQGIRG